MIKKVLISAFAILLFVKIAPAQVELLGNITPEEILQNLPEWQAVVDSYTPDLDIVSELQGVNEEIQVEIYLGTWCPDSKEHVSAYFKLMEIVRNPLIRTIYIGIPRNKEARQEFISGKDIQRIPTFIVLAAGQEKGRIIETPQISVEGDLWKIVRAK